MDVTPNTGMPRPSRESQRRGRVPTATLVAVSVITAALSVSGTLWWMVSFHGRAGSESAPATWTFMTVLAGTAGLGWAVAEFRRRRRVQRQRDDVAAKSGALRAALARAHQDLAAVKDMKRTLLDVGGVALWSWDSRKRDFVFGDNCTALFGYQADGTIDQPVFKAAIEPESRMRLVTSCDHASAQGGACACDIAIVLPSGARRWLHVRGQGRAGGIVSGVLLEITARMEAEEELRARRAELTRQQTEHLNRLSVAVGVESALVEAGAIAVIAADDAGTITFFNRGAERMLGLHAAEAIGRRLTDLHVADELAARASELSAAPERDGRSVSLLAMLAADVDAEEREWTWLKADGSRLSVVLTVLPFGGAGGRPGGLLVLGKDVSARHAMEERLHLQSAALEAAENAVVITNAVGVMCWVNAAFTALTGYTADEAVGRNIRLLSSGTHPKTFFAALWNSIRAGNVWRGEVINRRKDGTAYCEEMTITPVRDAAGQIRHFIAVKSDVTQRKRQEVMLRDAKRAAETAARAKSEFLAVMSHEIRTPMNGVIGLSNLLRSTELNLTQRRYIETIHTCGESLLSVINQILDFSKLEAGKLELEPMDFDVRQLVEDTLEMVADRAFAKGLELIGRVAPSVPGRLHGDMGRLRQVVLNLVNNAVKFTSDGEVAVEVTAAEESDTHVRLQVSVIDTGAGMSDEAVRRLFQPFTQADSSTTRKYGGTGLGLAISRQLVELMGGTIGVTSEPDCGSVFHFHVCLARQKSPVAAPAPWADRFGDLRVLVVEDRVRLRTTLSEIFNSWGMRADSVADARTALDRLRGAAEIDEAYSLLVAGSDLPGGGGMELADAIGGDPLLRTTRVVLLAPLGRTIDEAALREAGVAACVAKPVKHARLFEAVARALGVDRAVADATAAQLAAAPPLLPDAAHVRILFAEDNSVNQMVGVDQLGTLGFAADVVADGKEAIEAVRRIPYDVVLMDCMMPEVDGYEATRRIRELERQHGPGFESRAPLRIIAMTANALPGDREQCLAAGMDDYIAKPVCDEELRRALARWLPRTAVAARSDQADGVDSAVAIVDRRRLAQVTSVNPARTRRLIQTYLAGADLARRNLQNAIASDAVEDVRALAHRWAGSSGTCGLTQLCATLRRLEARARGGDLAGAPALFAECVAAHERTLPILGAMLDSPQPTQTLTHS